MKGRENNATSLSSVVYNDRWRIIIALIASVLSYYLTLYPADKLNDIVDKIANGTIDFKGIQTEIFYLIVVGIVLYVVYYFKEYYTFIGYDKVIRDLTYSVQQDVYKHTPVFFNKFSIGEVISRSTNDISNYIATFFGYGLLCIFDGVIYNLFITVMILQKSTALYTILVVMPLFLQTMYLVSRREIQEKYYNKMAKTMDKITEETLENVKGIRVIRTYNLLEKVRGSFISKLKLYSNSNVEYMKKTLLYQPLNTISVAISYTIAVAYGFYLIDVGTMTLGELIAICVVIGLLRWPYIALSELIIMAIELRQGMKRVSEITGQKAEINNDKAEYQFDFKDKIQFNECSFSYGDNDNEENVTLKNISFSIEKGQTIGIVGKTGSGKTTLIKQLLRLYPIEENMLIFDGKSVEQYYDYSIRDKIGYAPQEYQLFSKSILDNIIFYRDELKDNVDKVLEIADLKKDVEGFKDGINTLIGENGVSLSGGQKQRIGIARALLGQPEILILDDSLSAVDANTEKNIIASIKKERVGKTNIIVSHRISAVRHADKIVVLADGEILNIGTHDELLENCSWYRELDSYQNKEVEQDEN